MNYSIIIQIISCTILITLLVTATIIDIKKRIIPNGLVIIGFIVGGSFAFFDPKISIVSAVVAMASAGLLLWIISILSKGGLGMGDIKLFACVGLFLGIEKIFSAIMYAAILSGVVGILLLAVNFSNRKEAIPFAPFILFGVMITLGWCVV